jgi:hypothetical protein
MVIAAKSRAVAGLQAAIDFHAMCNDQAGVECLRKKAAAIESKAGLIQAELDGRIKLINVKQFGRDGLNFLLERCAAIIQHKIGQQLPAHKVIFCSRSSYWQHRSAPIRKGHFSKPKTEASADIAKLGAFFAQFVENFRAYCAGVDSGLMFPARTGKPINLENLARRVLAPALNRCAVCHHKKTDHGPRVEHRFERDESLPKWHGFHAFRRGSATAISAEQDPELASLMLRHSGTQVTERHYIKNSSQDRRAIAAKRVVEIGAKGKRQQTCWTRQQELLMFTCTNASCALSLQSAR